MRTYLARLGVAMLAGIVAAPGALHAQQWSYSGWAQYATGRYQFPTRTSSLYFANGLSMVAGPVRVSASIPVIVQDAGWTQYGGSGILPTGGMPGHDSSSGGMRGGMTGMMGGGGGMLGMHAGLGDPLARADFSLYRSAGAKTSLAITAAAKAPFASARSGFGTGRWDYAGGATVSSSLREILVLADAAYWVLGDSPARPFRNSLAYAISLGRPRFGDKLGVFASVSGTTSILTGLPGSLLAGVGASYSVSRAGAISASASVGATRSSPALTMGIGWQRHKDAQATR